MLRNTISFLVILIAGMATPLASGMAQAADQNELNKAASTGKLLAPQEALSGFAQGSATGRFIIMLKAPAGVQEDTSLTSNTAKTSRADAVKSQLNDFFTTNTWAEGLNISRSFKYMPGFAATLTLDQLNALLGSDQVKTVEEDRIVEPHLRQGIPLEKAETVRTQYSGAGLSVAVCDTGIDYNNTYLGSGTYPNGKVLGGTDTGENKADFMDRHGHGTACSGIAAGNTGDSGDYIGGVAYNAKLYGLKMTNTSTGGSAYTSAMVAAWEWVVTHQNDNPSYPIMIISTSFGSSSNFSGTCDDYSTAMTTAANTAIAAGITVFASSGNDGYCSTISWPACISGVIAVGAVYDANFGNYYPCINTNSCASTKQQTTGCTTGWYATDNTQADLVTSYSNSSSKVALLAPSNQAYTLQCATNGSTFNPTFGGTSAACPYAAGAAAALQSAAKARLGHFLTPTELKNLLDNTGDSITDPKNSMITPRINLARALTMVTQGSIPSLMLLLQ